MAQVIAFHATLGWIVGLIHHYATNITYYNFFGIFIWWKFEKHCINHLIGTRVY
jgi:hypothetical protein